MGKIKFNNSDQYRQVNASGKERNFIGDTRKENIM